MNDEHHLIEENTARLIAAGFGPETRPEWQVRAATLQRLRSRLRIRHAATAFPEHVLCLLLGSLMLMAAWLVIALTGADLSVGSDSVGRLCVTVLLLNWTFVPVGAVVIVIRRRNVQSTQESTA